MTEYQVRLRLFLFRAGIILLFGLLLAQLWRLQVLEGERYRQLADRNRFRVVEIDAPRGIIYDANGNLLVRNRPIFNVVVIPAYLPDDATRQARLFARLSDLLQLPITNGGEREIASHNAYFRSFAHHEYTRLPGRQVKTLRSRRLAKAPQGLQDAVANAPAFAPYQPVTIATDVDPQIAAIIEEERLRLPGVFVQTTSQREYLTGDLTAEILGYVGPIPPDRVDDYPAPTYNPNDAVGLVGLEAQYEADLHGIKGQEVVEVDVTGRKIKTIGDSLPARPGNNLILTLDLGMQKLATEALQDAIQKSGGQSGAAIVMNPQNGEILALVSLPSYDNNLFAQGISAREYSLLSEDKRTPLVNKAIGGLYPPGSTFKLVVAAGALEEGTVTPQQQFLDTGVLYLPNKFYPDDPDLAQPFFCWLKEGHGLVNLVSALAESCDVYFYQVGGGYEPSGYEGLGLERMGQYAERFGFGAPTGIDLPGEGAGLVPTPRWKRLNYAETWVTGDTYNMAIGQGFMLATPLQVLNAYAAFGNGGTLYRPHLVREIRNPQQDLVRRIEPQVVGRLNLSAETIRWVDEGLRAVVDWGTAKDAINLPGIPVAGKTGTAEFCDRYPQCLDREGRVKTSHAWFVAYAPADNPEVAAVAFVYGGGEGSLVAAPVVNRILRYYFGFERPPEEETETAAADAPGLPPGVPLTGRLLGSDVFPAATAAVNGFVRDAAGRGVPSVTVDFIAGEEVVASVVSGPNGQFDYNTIDPARSDTWRIRLPDYPSARPITLFVREGTRYFVEFQARDASDGS